MFSLDHSSRILCICGALTSFAGAFLLLPMAARSAAQANRIEPLVATYPSLRSDAGRAIEPQRDPFIEERYEPVLPTVPNGPASLPMAVGPLPNNLTNSGMIPLVPGVAAIPEIVSRITAIVTGDHPLALVSTAGVSEIKSIGESFLGSHIIEIGFDGLVLANGRRIAVQSGPQPNPPSVTPRVTNQPLPSRPVLSSIPLVPPIFESSLP